jgi:hypothetical protein
MRRTRATILTLLVFAGCTAQSGGPDATNSAASSTNPSFGTGRGSIDTVTVTSVDSVIHTGGDLRLDSVIHTGGDIKVYLTAQSDYTTGMAKASVKAPASICRVNLDWIQMAGSNPRSSGVFACRPMRSATNTK